MYNIDQMDITHRSRSKTEQLRRRRLFLEMTFRRLALKSLANLVTFTNVNGSFPKNSDLVADVFNADSVHPRNCSPKLGGAPSSDRVLIIIFGNSLSIFSHLL